MLTRRNIVTSALTYNGVDAEEDDQNKSSCYPIVDPHKVDNNILFHSCTCIYVQGVVYLFCNNNSLYGQ